jgi:hypothetical protein
MLHQVDEADRFAGTYTSPPECPPRPPAQDYTVRVPDDPPQQEVDQVSFHASIIPRIMGKYMRIR